MDWEALLRDWNGSVWNFRNSQIGLTNALAKKDDPTTHLTGVFAELDKLKGLLYRIEHEWNKDTQRRQVTEYWDRLRSMPEYGEGVQAFHAGEPCEDAESLIRSDRARAFRLGYEEAGKP